MIQFEVKGLAFRAENLNAMQQFHVSRRIAPLLPTLVPIVMQLVKSLPNDPAQSKPGDMAIAVEKLLAHPELVQPFMDGLASLPDASVDYIFNECLGSVRRVLPDNSLVRIWDVRSHMPLASDVADSEVLFPIVVKVLKENLGPFIRGLLMNPSAQQAAGVQP